MLTLIVRSDSKLLTADQFTTLVDVAVRMIRVVVTGLLRRDHLGRPYRMGSAKVEALAARRRVSVAEMAGKFTGPDSVAWLKEQRFRGSSV